MFTSKILTELFQSRNQKDLNQPKDKNTHLYQSLETFPITIWWKLLNNEVTTTELGLSKSKFEEFYDIYFEEFDSAEWRNLLRLQSKRIKEEYKIELIFELIKQFKVVFSIPEIDQQEYAKAGLVENIKLLFPMQKKINCFSDLEEIDSFLAQVYSSQQNVINTFVKEEDKKKDKLSIYNLVSKISTSLGFRLNPNKLSVMEFINYYKESQENGSK